MNDPQNVTLIGLGLMGKAIARGYLKCGIQVHAWNRGVEKRELAAQEVEGIRIYQTLAQAMEQSDFVVMAVVGDIMLKTANSIIQSIPATLWKGKTLAQFSTHEPTAIKAQERLMTELGAKLIGGAMMAVPETVGTNRGIFLVSSGDTRIVKDSLPLLEPLGRVVSLDGDDVGLASLMDIGFLQSMQFGLAGNELSCTIFQRYGVNQSFRDTYLALVPATVLPLHLETAKKESEAVFADEFHEMARTFLRASSHLAVFETHQFFFEQMGLHEETYQTVYLKKFRTVPDIDNVGPAAIVKEYHFSTGKKQMKA